MTENRASIIKSLAITAEVCGSQLSEGALVVMAMAAFQLRLKSKLTTHSSASCANTRGA